jgi:hypothetical protein
MSTMNTQKRKRLLDGVETKGSKKPRQTLLSHYDHDLKEMALQRISPTEMASRLRKIHGKSEEEIDGKKVSDRLRYLKKNSLIQLPPTNSPRNLRNCMSSFFILIYFCNVFQFYF